MAAGVAELAVGGAREDLAAVAIEELNSVSVSLFGFHDCLVNSLENETRKEGRKEGGKAGLACWNLKTSTRELEGYL